ncbi:MAG: hypothetical protein HY898_21315 [Deltaproteobacteria bacterium]|nr:hypothetical protein [Deltaproteobacteria bacterium]
MTVAAEGGPTVSGGDVPKFQENLIAPSALVVTAPSFDDFPPIDKPIGIAWTPFQGGFVFLQIAAKDVQDAIFCRLPSDAGTATLPAEVMAQFSPGPGNCLTVLSAGYERFQAGEFSVELQAMYVGTRPDGKIAGACSK